MRIFDSNDWRQSVNFVDENNVLVGYSLLQDCCEHADWFIADEIKDEAPEDVSGLQPDSLDGFVFDKNFFHEVYDGHFDGGGMVVFRLTNGDQVKYLHLFNYHNGYYGHGFEVKHGGEVVKEGVL